MKKFYNGYYRERALSNLSLINKFSNDLCENVAKIFNVRNRGVKLSQKLSVLKNTDMPAALIEVDFISNVNAERDLNVSSNIKAVALVIRDNLIDLFGLEAVASDVLYKVCIGAFKDKNNAINQVKLAKDKGFIDTYIIQNS